MPNRSPTFLSESLSLRFLLSPFKHAFVALLIVLLTFGASLIIHGTYQHQNLLAAELEMTLRIFANKEGGFHTAVARYVYQGFHWFFFEISGIDKYFNHGPQNSIDAYLFGTLKQHQDKLHILDQTLKIISVRLGNLAAYLPLLIILVAASLHDGLMQRKIRQENASRESSVIYHLSIYWRFGLIWTSTMLYLCLPVTIPPLVLLFPIGLLCVLIFTQAKYLKKYL